MADPTSDKLRDKLKKMHARLGSNNANEREAARTKIDELLVKNKMNWNDLTELLFTGNAQSWRNNNPYEEQPADYSPTPAPLDLTCHILQRHLHLTNHQRVAVTLWIAHTFLFHRFSITPRLAATSPVKGCGKTTLLNIVKALGCRARKTDHVTAAVLFRLIDRDRPTLLLDEADNQDLANNPTLRSVINSGHHCDGKIMRCLGLRNDALCIEVDNRTILIQVAGRCDDVLRLQAANGRTVTVLPLAIGAVIDETPGLRRSQLIQTGPNTIHLRSFHGCYGRRANEVGLCDTQFHDHGVGA